MRKVIGIGETLLDIIFRDNQPTAAVPGGSVFNAIVSLSRTGVPVNFISETGNDRVGDIILRFMRDNRIPTDHIYILPNGESTSTTELTTLAERLYPELFTDEGHFLLVFCDDGNGTFNCGYTVGTAASAVMDSEAVSILADELDYAYNNADTDEEVFSDAFSETAGRIMAAAEDEQRGQTTMLVVGGVVLVIAVGGAIAYVVKRRKAKQDEEQQRMEDILNTPLEKFGDKDVEDLADKYEDKD